MAVKGLIIRPDKTIEERIFTDLADYQDAVGGWIEAVNLKDGTTMYVDEEGLYKYGPEDFNSIATDVCGLGGRPDIMLRTPIKGAVVVIGPPDDEGESTDITATARRWVKRVAREAGGRYVGEFTDGEGGGA